MHGADGRRTPRRGDHVVANHAHPAHPGGARTGPRTQHRRDRRGRPGRRRSGGAHHRAAARWVRRWTPSAACPAKCSCTCTWIPRPGPDVTSTMLRTLDDAAAAALLEAVGPGVETPLMIVELRQLGGRWAGRTRAAVCCHILTASSRSCVAGWPRPPSSRRWSRRPGAQVVERMSPWTNGRNYLNFAEDPTDVRAGYPEDAWLRLATIRSAVDPDGVLVAEPSHSAVVRARRGDGLRPTSGRRRQPSAPDWVTTPVRRACRRWPCGSRRSNCSPTVPPASP